MSLLVFQPFLFLGGLFSGHAHFSVFFCLFHGRGLLFLLLAPGSIMVEAVPFKSVHQKSFCDSLTVETMGCLFLFLD
jgi:hypothetical protein